MKFVHQTLFLGLFLLTLDTATAAVTKPGADRKPAAPVTAVSQEDLGKADSRTIQRLSTVLVKSATREAQSPDTTAASVSVRTREQIEAQKFPNVASVLSTLPGTLVLPNGTPGQVASVFTRGTESNHTLLTIDGRRQSPDLAGLYDFTNLTIDNLAQVESVRTPSTAIHGGNAIGGVINLVTLSGKGLAEPISSFSFEAGSYGTFREVAASRGAFGLFDYAVEASRLDTDNQRDNNEYRNSSARGNFGFQVDKDVYLDVLATYNNSDSGVPNSIYFPDKTANLIRELWSVSPRLTWQVNDWWKSSAYVTHDRLRQYYENIPFGTKNRLQIETTTVDWQNTFQPFKEWQLIAGTTLWDTGIWQRNAANIKNIDNTQGSVGGFVQSQWQPFEDLNILTSGRYDHYTDFEGSFSWRQGVAYRTPCTRTLLHGSVSSSYTPPTFQDLYFPGFNNPNLKPESSVGWEAGVEQPFFNNKLMLGATYFFNNIQDFIQFAGSAPYNVARAETQGAEFTLAWRPIDEVEVRGNYTYTATEDMRTGQRLLRRPEHMANFDFIFRPVKVLTLSFGGSWVAHREDTNARTFARIDHEDYTTIRCAAVWQAHEHLQVWVRGENVLNQQYEPVHGFPALDSGLFGGVKVTF
jgi:vitamin B12 transporter